MDCSTPGFPILHHLPEFAQTHVHRVNDGIQPSHPLSPPSPPALNLYKHQSLFLWVSCLHHKVLELQLQHQSFQWIFRLISFRIDWLDLLAVQGTLKSLPEFAQIHVHPVMLSNHILVYIYIYLHTCQHMHTHTLGNGEGQGSLACCSPWGHKELNTT